MEERDRFFCFVLIYKEVQSGRGRVHRRDCLATSSTGKPKVQSKVLVFTELIRSAVTIPSAVPPRNTTRFSFTTHILSRLCVSGPTTTYRTNEKAHNVAVQNLKTRENTSDWRKNILCSRDSQPKATQMTLLGSTDF